MCVNRPSPWPRNGKFGLKSLAFFMPIQQLEELRSSPQDIQIMRKEDCWGHNSRVFTQVNLRQYRRKDDHLITQGEKLHKRIQAQRPPTQGTSGQLAQLSVESVNVDSSLLIYWVLRENERNDMCTSLLKVLRGKPSQSLSSCDSSVRPEVHQCCGS